MKWFLLIGFCILLSSVVNGEFLVGENKTFYLYCLNSTDGTPFGTDASLKVRNESGIFYQVSAVENIQTGVFKTSIANLTRNHCYTFELNCSTVGSFNIEWGSICTETNITDSNFANLGGIGALLSVGGVFIYFSTFAYINLVINLVLILFAQIFINAAVYIILKWSQVAAPVAVQSLLNYFFYVTMTLLALSISAFLILGIVWLLSLFKPKNGVLK